MGKRMRVHKKTGFVTALLLALSAVHVAPVAAVPAPAALTSLRNGITLIASTDHIAPRISVSLLVRAGAADETPRTAGWRRLLTDSMLRAVQAPATPAPGSTPAAG